MLMDDIRRFRERTGVARWCRLAGDGRLYKTRPQRPSVVKELRRDWRHNDPDIAPSRYVMPRSRWESYAQRATNLASTSGAAGLARVANPSRCGKSSEQGQT